MQQICLQVPLEAGLAAVGQQRRTARLKAVGAEGGSVSGFYVAPWGGLVYQDFPELSQVIHVLASATVKALLVIEEVSDT